MSGDREARIAASDWINLSDPEQLRLIIAEHVAALSESIERENAAAAEVVSLRGQITTATELHQPVRDFRGEIESCQGWLPDGSYGEISPACATCGTSDEYAIPWPCATATALNPELGR